MEKEYCEHSGVELQKPELKPSNLKKYYINVWESDDDEIIEPYAEVYTNKDMADCDRKSNANRTLLKRIEFEIEE